MEKLTFIGVAVTSVVCGLLGLKLLFKLRQNNSVEDCKTKRSSQRKRCYKMYEILLRKGQQVVCVDTSDGVENAMKNLRKELKTIRIIGLDCEWVTDSSHRRPVALLQIASQTGFCVLIRLCILTSSNIPRSLCELLRDRTILKFGVGISEDAKYLFLDYGIAVNGCVDLRNVVMRSKKYRRSARRANSVGLSSLCSLVLHEEMSKDFRVRCSDWEAETLTDKQIAYAANDALKGADIFTELNMENVKDNVEEGNLPEHFMAVARSYCQGIVDQKFVMEPDSSSSNHSQQKHRNSNTSANNTPKKLSAYSSRKTPLYHKCQLQAPDGQALCVCDISKAEWYIIKDLGEKVSDDPLIVRLKFEPSGRPETEENYYLKEKENICVVCGSTESYIRKNVIPHEYRKYFPPVMKSHRSHDVLLMCIPCHHHSGIFDSIKRQRYADLCNAPIGSESSVRFKRDPELVKVQAAAKALLNNGHRIPETRRLVLEQCVKDYYNLDCDVDESILAQTVQMQSRVYNDDYVPHGSRVVEYVNENGGLVSFEREWRQHFLDTMRPRFLPDGWSVDHSHDKLRELEKVLRGNIGH